MAAMANVTDLLLDVRFLTVNNALSFLIIMVWKQFFCFQTCVKSEWNWKMGKVQALKRDMLPSSFQGAGTG